MDALLRLIEQGEYNPGDRLPGEIELSRILGVSRPTLREAMGNLETRGVIERRHGVGTFITVLGQRTIQGGLEQLESVKSLAENSSIQAEIGYRVVNQVSATDEIADILGLQKNASLIRVQTTIRDKFNTFSYLDNYIPSNLVNINKLERFTGGSLLDYMIELEEPKISYTHTNIHAIDAEQEISDWLQVPDGTPLLILTETYFTETGNPVIFERNYFLSNFLNFRLVRQVINPRIEPVDGKNANKSIKPDQRPLYDQTIEALNSIIELSKYKPGDRLPPEVELAQILGVSHTTLREAMGTLENQGIIERRHGVGAFVTAPARGRLQGGLELVEGMVRLSKNAGVHSKREDWVVNQTNAYSETARKLEIDEGLPIIQVEVTLKGKQEIFAYLKSFVSLEFANLDELKSYEGGSLIDYLQERGKIRLDHAITNLYAIAADKETAQWMRIERGKPLLLLEETIYADNGKPIELSRNYFITTHLNFHIIRRIVRNR
ncbi:MAG: GntR family transcriptional regulator [Anaerolineaceae bacterium]|nr:GntR family transcriptional regulator [Anaerolineaceae bacterium]